MSLRGEAIQRWWPTTRCLDLVEGPVEAVAAALEAEVPTFLRGERLVTSWNTFPGLDAAFGVAPDYTNVPDFYLVLPSRSRWSVLWNNSFLCDGYASLCWNLTRNHHLTTMHWWADDGSGAGFTHCHQDDSRTIERYVQVARDENERWTFLERGAPLPDENPLSYGARRKRDRLNESSMVQLLARLGAAPWSEEFYALPEQRCFVMHRPEAPETVARRPASEVLRPG
jgi:hypothetical protein